MDLLQVIKPRHHRVPQWVEHTAPWADRVLSMGSSAQLAAVDFPHWQSHDAAGMLLRHNGTCVGIPDERSLVNWRRQMGPWCLDPLGICLGAGDIAGPLVSDHSRLFAPTVSGGHHSFDFRLLPTRKNGFRCHDFPGLPRCDMDDDGVSEAIAGVWTILRTVRGRVPEPISGPTRPPRKSPPSAPPRPLDKGQISRSLEWIGCCNGGP